MPAPILCPPRVVERAWIDYNGHMNMAYYNLVFDEALDHVLDTLGLGKAYVRERHCSLFTIETHVHFVRELASGDPIRVRYQLLDWDDKRLHSFAEMLHGRDGHLAATSEQLSLHVDLVARKAVPFADDVARRIAGVMNDHALLPRPRCVGRAMGIASDRSRLGASPSRDE